MLPLAWLPPPRQCPEKGLGHSYEGQQQSSKDTDLSDQPACKLWSLERLYTPQDGPWVSFDVFRMTITV